MLQTRMGECAAMMACTHGSGVAGKGQREVRWRGKRGVGPAGMGGLTMMSSWMRMAWMWILIPKLQGMWID